MSSDDKPTISIFDWAYAPAGGVKSLIISDIKTYLEHWAEPSHGLCRNVPRSAGVIFHYRGHPNKHTVFSAKARPANWKTCTFHKFDDSMRKYL
jgi:hypothetical protein